MNEVFFTADTHFDHDNIRRHTNRPFKTVEEMNEVLIDNWNSLVKPSDTVFILGDFAWKRHAYFLGMLSGAKILIRGNHDKMSEDCFKQFKEVHDVCYRQFNNIGIFMSHYAHVTWRNLIHGTWHIYGHSHGTLPEFEHKLACDVGVDVWGWAPLNLEILFKKMSTRITNQTEIHSRTEQELEECRTKLKEQNDKFRTTGKS